MFKAGITKAPPRIIEYRSYKHYNKQSFLQDLKYVNWSTLVDVNDVDSSVNSWCKCFTDLADMHVPIKKMKVRGISIPWMTAELSRAMQDRDYHLKKAQKTQSQHHWSCYRKLRCLVNKEVCECKSKYYESLIRENRNNPSGLWKTLNELTSRNTHSTALHVSYLMALKAQTHNLYQHFLILFSLASEIPWQTQSSKDFQQTYLPIIKYHSLIPHLNSRRSILSQSSNNYQILKLINLPALMASAQDCLKMLQQLLPLL